MVNPLARFFSRLFSRKVQPIKWPPLIPAQQLEVSNMKLGSGAFSVVKLGTLKKRKNEIVALKIFKKGAHEFFLKELTILEKIAEKPPHPNVIKILGRAETFAQDVLVMEWKIHGDLDVYLQTNPRVTHKDFVNTNRIAWGIIQGLFFLHSLGIIHADLKPNNILLDALLNPSITDFNLSRLLPKGESEAFLPHVHGAIRYASPEMLTTSFNALGEIKITCKTDIHTFGLLLILCASSLEYEVDAAIQDLDVLLWRRASNIPPNVPSEVPEPTRHLILHCLQYPPENRPDAGMAMMKMKEIYKAARMKAN